MDDNKIRITWYGTASVRISAGSSQLLIDPFFPYPDSKIKVNENAFENCSNILVSHGHYDHISSINRIICKSTKVFCTETPYQTLLKKGINKRNLCKIHAGSVFKIGDFKITAYKGKHIRFSIKMILKTLLTKRMLINRSGIITKILNFASFPEKGETLCYLIEAYGKRVIILGSLALAENTVYPISADLALFPYQGIINIHKTASELISRLKPKSILLTHFDDTFPPFSSEIDTTIFENHMKGRVPVFKLKHGGTIEI